MVTNKALISNTSAISRPVHSMYETRNELRLENQALILSYSQKLKTSSIKNNKL